MATSRWTLSWAIAQLKVGLNLPSDDSYLVQLLFAAQAHLIALLDTVFYLAFRGPTQSGKSTAVRSTVALAPEGIVLGGTTAAYFREQLDLGRMVGIQELGGVLGSGAKADDMRTMLRNGYQRHGSSTGFMVARPDGKGHTTHKAECFGPKVFDFHGGLDLHVLNRSIIIDMQPDASVERILGARKLPALLEPVNAVLAEEAARAKGEWTRERVEAHMDDPAFAARLRALGGTSPRDVQIGQVMLLLNDILGWGVEDALRRIIVGRQSLDDESDQAQVRDVLEDLMRATTDDEMLTENVLAEANRRRQAAYLRPFSFQVLGMHLRDLGAVRGKTLYKATAGKWRDRHVVLPRAFLHSLAHPAQPEQARLPAPTAPHAPELEKPSQSEGPGPDTVV